MDGKVIPALALLTTLAACGPGANDPPTSAEISDLYSNICKASSEFDIQYFTFVDAKKVDDGVTQTIMGTKAYSVVAALSYRPRMDTWYQCMGRDRLNYSGKQRCMFFDVLNPKSGNFVPAGGTITCGVPLDFVKADEGWLPAGFDNSHLIKR